MNLPSCRLVPLCCGAASPSLCEGPPRDLHRATGCSSTAPIPVNPHVCAESRVEGLQAPTPAPLASRAGRAT